MSMKFQLSCKNVIICCLFFGKVMHHEKYCRTMWAKYSAPTLPKSDLISCQKPLGGPWPLDQWWHKT